uniref:SSD domain-containing protein n=1 Tax=Haemonchus contortus TaxID=6289 RepID=A0A7I4Y8L5_HAECO
MRPLERFFYAYGDFLARHPWPFVIVPVLLTIISSYGMLSFHSQDDIWDMYAPLDGLSRLEEQALKPFEYASGSHHYRMQILVTRKDGGNILTIQGLDELYEVQKFITENVTITDGSQEYHYADMCGVYCEDSNAAIILFLQTAISSDGPMRLTYPNAEALQKRVFLGFSLGNLTYREVNPDEVKEARLLLLHFMVDTSLPHGKKLAEAYERKLHRIFNALTETSTHFSYSLLSRDREISEQRAITITALPFLGVTALVLIGFMFITLVDFPLYRSQYMESVVGMISPAMALWTSSGLLFWMGFPFSNILTVVPFLVVTIGIDDAFLVLAGWRQSTKGASLEQRMAESISISGASVTVTSVTDVLCFAIGLFANMPVVRLFCLFTTVALFLDFVYQLTFFSAMMSFIVRRQMNIDEKIKERKIKDANPSISDNMKGKMNESMVFSIMLPSFTPPVQQKKPKRSRLELFVSILQTKTTKTIVMLIFFAHIGVSTYLATKVNTDFNMENLYLEGSPLTEISRQMQDFVLRESFVVNFAVKPMPDFSDESTRERFNEMVGKLETLPKYGWGPEATVFWLREYNTTIQFWEEEEEQDYWSPEALLKNYREYGLEEKYIITKKNKNGVEVMDGFYFMIDYHNMRSFLEVMELMRMRRDLLASYPSFQVLSHHPFEKVPTESAASAPKNFLQTAVSAVILMSILVLLFVMNWEAIISVVVSIVSICLGIVAYLHLWGVCLDAVSLISILMSVGFSVDYSAHVCYHYFAHAAEEERERKNEVDSVESGSSGSGSSQSIDKPLKRSAKEDSARRLLATFHGVGWPVVQSGLSTIIGYVAIAVRKSLRGCCVLENGVTGRNPGHVPCFAFITGNFPAHGGCEKVFQD